MKHHNKLRYELNIPIQSWRAEVLDNEQGLRKFQSPIASRQESIYESYENDSNSESSQPSIAATVKNQGKTNSTRTNFSAPASPSLVSQNPSHNLWSIIITNWTLTDDWAASLKSLLIEIFCCTNVVSNWSCSKSRDFSTNTVIQFSSALNARVVSYYYPWHQPICTC